MESIPVFIDGAYLSLVVRKLYSDELPPFDLFKFAAALAAENRGVPSKVYYYTAPPYQSPNPNKEESKRKSAYDRFVNRLRRSEAIVVREGYCQKTEGGFKQKGVDTYITIDLMRSAFEKKSKSVLLVLCDMDFVPVITEIKEKEGMQIILAYLKDGKKFSLSKHLLGLADRPLLIERSHIEKAMFKKEDD